MYSVGKNIELELERKRNNIIPMYRAMDAMYAKQGKVIKSIHEVGYDTEYERNLQNSGIDTVVEFEDGTVETWERKMSDGAKKASQDKGKKAVCIAEIITNGQLKESWGHYTNKCDWICFGRHVFNSNETIIYVFQREGFFQKFWEFYNRVNNGIELTYDLLMNMINSNEYVVKGSGYVAGLIDSITVNSNHKGHEGFCVNIMPENWYRKCKYEWNIPCFKLSTDKPVDRPNDPYIDGTYKHGE